MGIVINWEDKVNQRLEQLEYKVEQLESLTNTSNIIDSIVSLKKENEELYFALDYLLKTKYRKDKEGKTDGYVARRKIAWEQAEHIIQKINKK